MNTTRVYPERVYHPDQSKRITELEREVKVLNAMIDKFVEPHNEICNSLCDEIPEEIARMYCGEVDDYSEREADCHSCIIAYYRTRAEQEVK